MRYGGTHYNSGENNFRCQREVGGNKKKLKSEKKIILGLDAPIGYNLWRGVLVRDWHYQAK